MKNKSALRSMSSGCDQPACAAPIHTKMECTGACNLHSKTSLAHLGCTGLAETVQGKPVTPMPPIQHTLNTMQLSFTHSELHSSDLVSYKENSHIVCVQWPYVWAC